MKSLADLEEIKKRALEKMRVRQGEGDVPSIVVGMGTCGIAAGARATLSAILDELAKRELGHVELTQTGCIGMCDQEPLVEVSLPGTRPVTYGRVDPARARQIVVSHIVNQNPIGPWIVRREG
jgi:NADP-reducing hydrogenase subunit HndB